MEAFSTRRVFVVGPEKGLLAQVAQELEATNMAITFLPAEGVSWEDNAELEERFAREQPRFVLHETDIEDARLRSREADSDRAELVRRARLLGSLCARHGAPVMHLSSYYVFGGDTKSAYDESDPPAPLDSYGKFVVDLEEAFVTAVERHMILRFSWLIDTAGDNLFTRILRAMLDSQNLPVSPTRRGAPTWKSDARRVVCGVVRQVVSGAQNWGYFHYCSADPCIELEFAREVQETLAEIRDFKGEVVARDDEDDSDHYPLEPASAVLNSRRIRNNFGVHGRSWRQGLKAQINHWLEQQEGDSTPQG